MRTRWSAALARHDSDKVFMSWLIVSARWEMGEYIPDLISRTRVWVRPPEGGGLTVKLLLYRLA